MLSRILEKKLATKEIERTKEKHYYKRSGDRDINDVGKFQIHSKHFQSLRNFKRKH